MRSSSPSDGSRDDERGDHPPGDQPVRLQYFSDVLCVWAYVMEIRLERLMRDFAGRVEIDCHFCPVFPDAQGKIARSWRSQGGFEGFAAHLREVGERFPHVTIRDDLWRAVRPRSSTGVHLFLRAVDLVAAQDRDDAARPFAERLFSRACWQIRRAFFAEGADISDWRVHRTIATRIGVDYDAIASRIRSSEAVAALDADYRLAEELGVRGSPTFVMNDGRQKLYGNVGYRLIVANVEELLRKPGADEASWC